MTRYDEIVGNKPNSSFTNFREKLASVTKRGYEGSKPIVSEGKHILSELYTGSVKARAALKEYHEKREAAEHKKPRTHRKRSSPKKEIVYVREPREYVEHRAPKRKTKRSRTTKRTNPTEHVGNMFNSVNGMFK